MPRQAPISVTVEEAVACLINLDFLPDGMDVMDLTAAFLEEAEVAVQNGSDEDNPDMDRTALKLRYETCASRHALAASLFAALEMEIRTGASLVVPSEIGDAIRQRVDLREVSYWAQTCFGISVPQIVLRQFQRPSSKPNTLSAVDWSQVELKIYANYVLGFKVASGPWKTKPFREAQLMASRALEPNHLGGLLIGFSQRKKYPDASKPEGKHKVAISKLRSSLQGFTGLAGDPFFSVQQRRWIQAEV